LLLPLSAAGSGHKRANSQRDNHLSFQQRFRLEALFFCFLSNYSLCDAPQRIDFCFENTVYILFSKDTKSLQ
jgi:hypothetical protein